MASPIKRYTKPCRHRHLSGRDCKQRVGREPLTGQFPDPAYCAFHAGNGCSDCVAMARAFPTPSGRLLIQEDNSK